LLEKNSKTKQIENIFTDSCVNRCGERYDPSMPCQCYDLCSLLGNCCEDFEPSCI